MKTKRKIKRFSFILTALLLLGIVTACSTSKAPDAYRAETKAAEIPNGAAGLPTYENSANQENVEALTATTNANSGVNNPISVAPPDSIRKIISTVNAELLVPGVQEAVQKIIQSTEALGGYVSSSSVYESGQHYSASLHLRMPSDKVEGFATSLANYGKITRQDSSTDDITDSYYDIEARLKNAKAQEVRLIEIMNQANSVEDLLRVRTELDKVQERIEQFQGKLKMWDQLTAYSSIHLSISEEAKFSTIDDPVDKPLSLAELWTSIKKGFSSSLKGVANFFAGLFIGLSYAIVPLLLLGLLALVIVLIVRAIIRRRAKRRSPPKGMMPPPYVQNMAPLHGSKKVEQNSLQNIAEDELQD